MVEAELRRRDVNGLLVDWRVNADGTEPTADQVARDRLAAILAALAGRLDTRDSYTGGESLPDQAGAGAVLLFTFAARVDLVWVRVDGGTGRADPFGGVPSSSAGVVCDDGVPQPLTVACVSLRVWAPAGATVAVWGYRY